MLRVYVSSVCPSVTRMVMDRGQGLGHRIPGNQSQGRMGVRDWGHDPDMGVQGRGHSRSSQGQGPKGKGLLQSTQRIQSAQRTQVAQNKYIASFSSKRSERAQARDSFRGKYETRQSPHTLVV